MLPHIPQKLPDISPDLQAILEELIDSLVVRLDNVIGAGVATLEQGMVLVIRAYAWEPLADGWQDIFEDPELDKIGRGATMTLEGKEYQQNLSVKAMLGRNGRPHQVLSSPDLYDLLRPLVSTAFARRAQSSLGIRQVVTVPFYAKKDVEGCLLAAARAPLSPADREFLAAFARQAAAAIQSQRHLTAMEALERITYVLQSKIRDETEVLHILADAVVQELGYAGAMIATLEAGNALPVRAYAVDVPKPFLQQLETAAGTTLSGPAAVVYLDDERYQDNLSVRAIKGPQDHLISSELHDLLRPIAPRAVAKVAQQLLGIKQVIALPFYLEGQAVGNLFVATRKPSFSSREIKVLTAFSQHAAIGIHNARTYREAEEQRQIAQSFGRMAFSATTTVHALRNHVGIIRATMYLMKALPQMSAEQQQQVIDKAPEMLNRLDKITQILDHLHEPWRLMVDQPVAVNDCILRALRHLFPVQNFDARKADIDTEAGVKVHIDLQTSSALVMTSDDMLSEAFRILIKNAVEALQGHHHEPHLWIGSRQVDGQWSEISVRDNGTGIKPEHLSRIFDLGWSTKEGKGMGFGLFWARDFVNGLGGSIDVESVFGEGATFRVRLPAAVGFYSGTAEE